jgi:hypothetical protein
LAGILAYLKTLPKGKGTIDTSYPIHFEYPVETIPDTEEEIPNDIPMSNRLKSRMIVYVDADHEHDLVTTRSITGVIVILNNTPTI